MRQRSRVQQLTELQREIHGSYGFWGADELRDAVIAALREPSPLGEPETIRFTADLYRKGAARADTARGDLVTIGRQRLPQVWTGVASVTGAEVVDAAARGCERIAEQVDRAARALGVLADGIEQAQALDATGRGPLEHARQLLDHSTGWFDYDGAKVKTAHHEAMAGVDALVRAAEQAEHAGTEAARELHQSASFARAGRLQTTNLTAADRIVLSDAAVPGGPHDGNLILTADQSERAADRLDALGDGDRERFEALLADARSPQERAYLLKALAAGYGIGRIEAFDKTIHAHGDDPRWLRDHLTPIVDTGDETPNAHHDLWYEGRQWTQGPHPTCAASSIVTARAQVDPLYALELTTGGHPDDPAFDSGDAFAERLLDEQNRVYDDGRHWWADLPVVGYDGMTNEESTPLLNDEVGARSGDTYQTVTMDGTGGRQDTLPAIEQAVDDGDPVVVSVHDSSGGHDMVIVGHDGEMLEIYNPWGYTVWVSEEQFVDGRLDEIDDGVPSTPTSVRLPR